MTTWNLTFTSPTGTVVDVTEYVEQGSLERALGDASATLEVTLEGYTTNHVMDTVSFSVDGTVRFTGKVKEQNTTKSRTALYTRILCADNTDKLQHCTVISSYTNQTAKQILVDLVSNFATWVTTDNVTDVGGVIEQMTFDYDTFAEAIQKLADVAGAYWYLDKDDDLHFFQTSDGAAGTNYDAATNIQRDSFTLKHTALEMANRIYIIGAKSASANYTDMYIDGDGLNNVWSLAYVPNYPEVKESTNGGSTWVDKTIEVEKGETSDKDYVYNKKEKALKRVGDALPSGTRLWFRFRPTVQVIDYFEDSGSVATYGLYEKVIRDRKITDKSAARKRGRAELKTKKSILNQVSWSTREWEVNPGEVSQVTVPAFSYNAPCRIESISVTFSPANIVANIEATEVAT